MSPTGHFLLAKGFHLREKAGVCLGSLPMRWARSHDFEMDIERRSVWECSIVHCLCREQVVEFPKD